METKQPVLRLCTFEVATHLGRHRRLGASVDGRIVDLNFATAWYLAQTGEHEPHRLADALVPATLFDFLRAGLRAIHTTDDLFAGAGPNPPEWWKLDAAPRGPNDETLVYEPGQVSACALMPGRHTVGPDGKLPSGECRPSVGAVIGASGLVGLTLVNECGGMRAMGPCLARPHDFAPAFQAPPKATLVVRVNGAVRGHAEFDGAGPFTGIPGDIVTSTTLRVPLTPGDVVEVELPKLGVLRNHVA